MAGESEWGTFTGQAVGRANPSGGVKWRGKLAFLNNVIGLYETDADICRGNVRYKIWEWK